MHIQGLRQLTPYYFMLPALLLMAAGLFYPVVHAFYSSFFDWRLGQPLSDATFVGWENYLTLWHDEATRASFLTTLRFASVVVILEMALGMGLALLLDRPFRGMSVVRSVFMLPMMVAPIVVGLIWRYIYHPSVGPLNRLLTHWGFEGVEWLSSPDWAFWSVTIADVWQWTPFIFVLCLAGLQSLPRETLEAAKLDGANAWQCLLYVKLPLMMPVLIVATLLRLIDAFKVLEVVFIMTKGGPGAATDVLSLHIYQEAFVAYELGRASALSNLLLLLVMVVTLLLLVCQAIIKRRNA